MSQSERGCTFPTKSGNPCMHPMVPGATRCAHHGGPAITPKPNPTPMFIASPWGNVEVTNLNRLDTGEIQGPFGDLAKMIVAKMIVTRLLTVSGAVASQ